ncbi:uncharacterized protein BT62DRAFT_259502 [Guyanagaster necrorhizus]|uniref:Uncharacterized protein n=1 Tax=Guyanagaster necrorhizus TaxID=856835 RepID=A0A9P8AQP5_9AGAR|nr:uncharacterized protein BT62DRAFT_259502 [Guyanagaster necrorhizus MCA 3950]KAG7444215.1 hypothetical protein BT62DRAFT_259502 [Guyanagaster necrorhizus MCA 3950]
MAFYRTLQELDLLPPPYLKLDTSHISRGMTPISARQRMTLEHLSASQKDERTFTASVEPTLLSDLLLALDEDLSRSTAFSDQYAKYRDAVKDNYEDLLSALDDSHNELLPSLIPQVSESTVDSKLSKMILKHAERTVLHFIPRCWSQYRNSVSHESIPGLWIVPDAMLSYPNCSPTLPEFNIVINKGENQFFLYLAGNELIKRLKSVGLARLDYPHTIVNNQDNWWLLLNKSALYFTDVDPAGADIVMYYSCNAFLIMWRQRNDSFPDHIFISDVKGNFRGNSLEQQFRSGTISDAKARTIFSEPEGGYQSYPHIHDVYLAIVFVAALAANPLHAVHFPSLEAFRSRRRVPPPVVLSNVYDIHGRDLDDDTSIDENSAYTPASIWNPVVPRAFRTFDKACGATRANLFWTDPGYWHCNFVCFIPSLIECDIVLRSRIQSSVHGYTYLANVRGLQRRFVLKVYRFDAFGWAEIGAYIALKKLQGSIVPACYGFGYVGDLPWILLEYIQPPPPYISFSDLRQISLPHRLSTEVKSSTLSGCFTNWGTNMVNYSTITSSGL